MNNSIAGVRVRILLRINRIMGNIVDDSSLTIIRMIVPRISRDTYGRILAKYYSFPPDFHFNDQRLALNHNDLELQNVVWRGTVIEPRLQYRRYGAVPQIRFLPQSVTKSRLVLTNGRCVARRTFFFHPFLSHTTLSAAALASKPAITKENGGLTPKRMRELDRL